MAEPLPLPDPTADDTEPEAGFGALQTALGPLPLKALDVKVAIVGLITRTTVAQTFVNTHKEPLEAVYIFPLPPRDCVSGFTLRVGGKRVLAKLFERDKARRKYAKARGEGLRAALAEEDRPNVFTLSVGNLMPGDVAEVTFELAGLLGLEGSEAQWRFPLVVAPRYIPGTPLDVEAAGLGTSYDTDQVPDASRLNPPTLLPGYPNPVRLGIEVEWDLAGLPITEIRSTLHAVTETTADGRTRLRLAQAERLDRDFVLRAHFAPTEVWGSALLVPDEEGLPAGPDGSTGTLMVTLLPPDLEASGRSSRDVVFLLDQSGSMGGWKMAAARRAMAQMVELLGPTDRFEVIRFATDTKAFGGGRLLPATAANRGRAAEYLAATEAQGGTEILGAVHRALELLGPAVPGREAIVCLVTDGQVGNEHGLMGLLGGHGAHGRFQIIGVDVAANESLLMRLAQATKGWFLVAENNGVLEEVLLTAKRKFGQPILTDLRIITPALRWLPETLVATGGLDLYPGTPVILTARYLAGAEGTPILVGGNPGEPGGFTRTFAARILREPALRSVWARFRLRDLEDAAVQGPRRFGAEREMTELSLAFGLLSRFTAWLAVEEIQVVNPGGVVATLLQPVERPRGWEEEDEDAPYGAPSLMSRSITDLAVPCILRMSSPVRDVFDSGQPGMMKVQQGSLPRLTGRHPIPSLKADPVPEEPQAEVAPPERPAPDRAVVDAATFLQRYLDGRDFRAPTEAMLQGLFLPCEHICQLLDAVPGHGDEASRCLHQACEAILKLDLKASLRGPGRRLLLAALGDLEQALKAFLPPAAPRPEAPRNFWSLPRW